MSLNYASESVAYFSSRAPSDPNLSAVSLFPGRNNLAQLKDAYTKLFEDYNELKEEQKKREVHLFNVTHVEI